MKSSLQKLNIPNILLVEYSKPQNGKEHFITARFYQNNVIFVVTNKFCYRFVFQKENPHGHEIYLPSEMLRTPINKDYTEIIGLRVYKDKVNVLPKGNLGGECITSVTDDGLSYYGTDKGYISNFGRRDEKYEVFFSLGRSVVSLGYNNSKSLLFVGGVDQFCIFCLHEVRVIKWEKMSSMGTGGEVKFLCCSANDKHTFFFRYENKLYVVSKTGFSVVVIPSKTNSASLNSEKSSSVAVHVKPGWLIYVTDTNRVEIMNFRERVVVVSTPLKEKKTLDAVYFYGGVVWVFCQGKKKKNEQKKLFKTKTDLTENGSEIIGRKYSTRHKTNKRDKDKD
jgi:hypothetical protein